jgi:hypothetical protein
LVAEGTPEQVATVEGSATGEFLRERIGLLEETSDRGVTGAASAPRRTKAATKPRRTPK